MRWKLTSRRCKNPYSPRFFHVGAKISASYFRVPRVRFPAIWWTWNFILAVSKFLRQDPVRTRDDADAGSLKMKRRASALAGILFAGLLSLGLVSRPLHSADAPESPSRSFEFNSIVHVPAMPAGSKELRLWIPLPYEETYQSISELKIESPF